MKARNLLTALVAAAAATCSIAAPALADSTASDGTQMCLPGAQIDYYRIVGGTDDNPPILDYGSLVHGSDETGPFVVAQSYSDCVSFIAKNSQGKSSNTTPVHYMVFVLKTVTVSN